MFDTLSVPIIEGTLNTLTLTPFQINENTTSSGNVSRRIYLGSKDVADGTVRII